MPPVRRACVVALASVLGAGALVVTGPVAQAAPGAPGTPYTTGGNSFGQLGNGSSATRLVPAAVSGLTDVVDEHGGREHVVALTAAGRVYTWGSNVMGQLGLGGGGNRNLPTATSLTDVTAVTTGHYHSLALGSDGRVRAWGNNTNGQLGDGTTTQRNSPVLVSGLTDVTAIAAGRDMSYALRTDGTVWAWGANGNGELGDGSSTRRTTPVQVVGLSGVVSIAGGRNHGLAVRSDGTLWAWGWNRYGQLGDGTTTSRRTPVQVATGMTAVAGGAHHSYGLRSDGQVMAWGRNYRNELGDGTTTTRTRPVAVQGVTDAVAIGSGRDHGLAVLTDGRVMAWGQNTTGQLGDGTTTSRSRAVLVSGVQDALAVSGGGEYSVILVGQGGPPPPQPPVARATVTCDELDCTADGSASTDADGTISTYQWTFGDGSPAVTGETVSHGYAADGTYEVTLTVTDDDGLTGTTTRTVSVSTAPPAGVISAVGAVGATANATSLAVTAPGQVQAGDGLVAVVSLASASVSMTAPSGWTEVGQASTSQILTRVFRRTAVPGDAGASVRFTFSSQVKAALQVAAYRGVAAGAFVTAAFQPFSSSGTARTAPTATVTVPGSWAVGYWVDRTSTNHTWSVPAGLTTRATAYGSGGGQVSAVLADSDGTVPSGSYSPGTATAGASSSQAIAATLVLTP